MELTLDKIRDRSADSNNAVPDDVRGIARKLSSKNKIFLEHYVINSNSMPGVQLFKIIKKN